MIELNKKQAQEIRDLFLIMNQVIKANRTLFNISIEKGTEKSIKTLNKKINPTKTNRKGATINENK